MPESAKEKTDDSALPGAPSQAALRVKKAQSGNRAAFHELVEKNQEAVFRMVYYRTRSKIDAEDLTQEIFLQAFKSLHRLKNAESFRSWLFRIALNRTRDFHRKNLFRAMFKAPSEDVDMMECESEMDDGHVVLEHLMKKDFWGQIGKAMNQLSRMEREVFFLRFFDHLSIKEITEAVRKNESTVKTCLYRALKKFRKDSSIQALLDYNVK
jgi:RNA polymerase sigma-70 factor (ECF subfamily)